MRTVRIPWFKDRKEAKESIEHSRNHRIAAEAELEATQRKLAVENTAIVQPLRRMREEMLRDNHVTERVRSILRESR
jgi:hypothetical protein